jgi:2-polyprenyl-3-methyl-5-hydroxy-6-metoxy-1,4-benzoquinol methylase
MAMDGYFNLVRDEIAPLLPENPTLVMDVGCGAGATLRWLKQIRRNITTVGVEINETIAAVAASVADEVVVTDLDAGLERLAPYRGSVDVLLLLDVLEHLRDPWSRLKEFRSLLSPSGVVIASIPNVRNFKVLLPLLFSGEWRYQSAGILDRTHLRFFTRSGVLELFHGAGFETRENQISVRRGRFSCKRTARWIVERLSGEPVCCSGGGGAGPIPNFYELRRRLTNGQA